MGEVLTELHLLTDDPRVLELADRVVDITFNLHQAADQADRDGRGDLPGPRTTPSSPQPAVTYESDRCPVSLDLERVPSKSVWRGSLLGLSHVFVA